jgi:hypothetical protein
LAVYGRPDDADRDRDRRHRFHDLDGFSAEFSTRALPVYRWRGNLDAFNDILGGGFGTPEGGFVLRWLNSSLSADRLGYDETVKYLDGIRQTCHPTNVPRVEEELAPAKRRDRPTLFDIIVEIGREHGHAGAEAEDNAVLELA